MIITLFKDKYLEHMTRNGSTRQEVANKIIHKVSSVLDSNYTVECEWDRFLDLKVNIVSILSEEKSRILLNFAAIGDVQIDIPEKYLHAEFKSGSST